MPMVQITESESNDPQRALYAGASNMLFASEEVHLKTVPAVHGRTLSFEKRPLSYCIQELGAFACCCAS